MLKHTILYRVALVTTNPGARGTDFIPYRSTLNGLHAVRFCSDTGTPMTHVLTLDLEWVRADDSGGRVLKELRQRVTRWWRDQRDRKGRDLGSFKGMLVIANPGYLHGHWLLHLPEEVVADFLAVVVSRLAKITGVSEERATDACHLKPVGAPGTLAKYVLKGVDPYYADHFHIEAQPEGFVEGRRVSISRAISKTARKRAGWVRKRRGTKTT